MTGKPSFRQGAQEGNCRPSGVKDCINIHFRGLDACLCSIYSFTLRKEKIVCSQTKNFFPHINSGYSACRGKNPPEMGIFRCTERANCFFCGFFVLFSCISPTRIYGQNVGGSASQVSPEEERSGGQAVPVCFRLVKKLSGCLFDFFREARASLIGHRGRIEGRMDDSRRYGIDVLTDCAGKVRFSFFFAPLGVFCELTIFAYANDGEPFAGTEPRCLPVRVYH